MDNKIFNRYREIIYEKAGIALSQKKHALVRGRISKRMRALGIEDFGQYLNRVESDSTGNELTELLDAISTNVTRFFREQDHFDFLAEATSNWLGNGQKKFRFWSAACSTGEEPYGMAMILSECLPESGIDWKILATDISTQVLKTAARGEYSSEKLKNVSKNRIKRFFHGKKPADNETYIARPELRNRILFRRLNLAVTPYPMQGPIDIIFARNVMIYFSQEIRERLVQEAHRLLRQDGYLIVGHAESLTGCLKSFKSVRPSVYIKK